MKFKSNIKKSLDVLRKEIGNNENMVYSKDSSKKVLLFVNYINNRIENLLKKEDRIALFQKMLGEERRRELLKILKT